MGKLEDAHHTLSVSEAESRQHAAAAEARLAALSAAGGVLPAPGLRPEAEDAVASERRARAELERVLHDRAGQIEQLVAHVLELREQLSRAPPPPGSAAGQQQQQQPVSRLERERYSQASSALHAARQENEMLRSFFGILPPCGWEFVLTRGN